MGERRVVWLGMQAGVVIWRYLEKEGIQRLAIILDVLVPDGVARSGMGVGEGSAKKATAEKATEQMMGRKERRETKCRTELGGRDV